MSKELSEAFEKYQTPMFNAARAVGANQEDAQDAVLKACVKLTKFKDTISFVDEKRVRSLFCSVARACAITAYNSKKFHKGVTQDWMDINHGGHETLSAFNQSLGKMYRMWAVHSALSKMPPIERWIAWQYYALDASLREIVEDLKEKGEVGWSHQSLSDALRKLIKPKLKALLTEEGLS